MKIAIAGFGNIGRIYARSIVKLNLTERKNVMILARSEQSKRTALDDGFECIHESPALIADAEIVVIAVKPQDFSVLASFLKQFLKEDQIIVSLMAGITIQQIKENLAHSKIIRAMPNSPIALGMGMTGFCSSSDVMSKELRKAEQLLSTTGRTLYIDDEKKMDAVTAVSGSGPAYFYFFVKSMIESAEKLGFESSVAALLVKQTMLGAFHVWNSSEDDLDKLISTFASKGGTTQEALKVFEQRGFASTIESGLKKAEERGRELSGELNKH